MSKYIHKSHNVSVYGDSPEILCEQNSRGHQEEYQWIPEQKVQLPAKSLLGSKRYLGQRLFCLTVEINEEVIRRYVQHQAEEETGQAQLEF